MVNASAGRRLRIVVAIVVGVACAWASQSPYLGVPANTNGADFGYVWRAAQWLMSGQSPYARMDPASPYGVGGPFLYPLTAAAIMLPLALVPVLSAMSTFMGISAGLLAYGLTSRGWWGLSGLVSPPLLLSLQTANWPPLLAAAALLPALGWLAAAKPNLGLVVVAYAPRWWTIAGVAALTALTLIAYPRWPLEWLEHLGRQPVRHLPALFWPAGVIGLAGLLRWRTPEGRALATLTVVPTATLPYDWLLLVLCARTGRETAALVAMMWVGWLAIVATAPNDLVHAWTRGHLFLSLGWIVPAAALVLRRPNQGPLAGWLEGAAGALPTWLRGSSGAAGDAVPRESVGSPG